MNECQKNVTTLCGNFIEGIENRDSFTYISDGRQVVMNLNMSLKTLRALTGLFIFSLVGIVLSFAMSVVTVIQTHRAENAKAPEAIVTPATSQ